MCSELKPNYCKYVKNKGKGEVKYCEECAYNSKNNQKLCVQCIDGFRYISQSQQCIKDCPIGQFLNSKFVCQNCIDNCQLCNDEKSCQLCDDDKFLSSNFLSCDDSCGQLEHLTSPYSNRCQLGMVTDCVKYEQVTGVCLECENYPLIQQGIQCVDTCPIKFYQSDQFCLACLNPLCEQCIQSGEICKKCDETARLKDGKCQKICEEGYYTKNDVQCEQCSITCKSCQNSATECVRCHDGYMLYLGDMAFKCRQGTECQVKYYQDPNQQNVCRQCPIECQKCVSLKTCFVCYPPYYNQKYNCVLNCYKGFGKNRQQQKCTECQENCMACGNDYLQCEQCQFHFYYNQIKNLCLECDFSCGNCTGPLDNECADCRKNFEFDIKYKKCIRVADTTEEEPDDDDKDDQDGEIINQPQQNYILYIIFSIVLVLLIISIIVIIIYCKKIKQNAINNKQILLKNDFIQEMGQQEIQKEEQNFSQIQINEFEKLHQQHKLSEQQFKIQYKRIQNLGQGSFGIVEQFYDKINKTHVAIKFFKNIKNDNFLKIGIQEAKNIQYINEQSPLYTINLKSYFIINCENIDNSIRRYQNQQKQKQNSNIKIKNSKESPNSVLTDLTNNEFQNQQQNNNPSKSSFSSLYDSIQNDSYTLKLQEQELQQSQQQLQNQDKQNKKLQINNPSQVTIDKSQSPESQILDLDLPEENEQYKELAIVFELADFSLSDKLQKRKKYQKKFSQIEVLQFIHDMAYVLDDFHNKLKMAHRDIKPHNILYVNNCWKLCDFGMSKFLDNARSVTNNHTMAGTLNYQSPEQKNNFVNQLSQNPQMAIPLNPFKCDVFSLGITVYEIITLNRIDNMNQNYVYLNMCLEKYLLPEKNDYGRDLIDLVLSMLEWKSDQRSSVIKIKAQIDILINEYKENNNLNTINL